MRTRRIVVVIICEFDYLCKSHPLKMLRDLILYINRITFAQYIKHHGLRTYKIDILKLLASSMYHDENCKCACVWDHVRHLATGDKSENIKVC